MAISECREKIWRVLIAAATQTVAKMQTWVFDPCQAFTSLEVDPPTSGHSNT